MGEKEQFYVENNHEAIVSDEMFERAQEILRMRSKKHSKKNTSRDIVESMLSVVCVLAVSVVELISEGFGTMEQIMKNRHGNVEKQLSMAEKNVAIQKAFMKAF